MLYQHLRPKLKGSTRFLLFIFSSEQPGWSPSPLPPPPPSCTRTLTWTVTTGRAECRGWSRSAGISCGHRTAPWGTARARWGAKSKETSCYSKGGGGGARRCPLALTPPPPAVSPPLLLTLPFSLLLVFQHKNLTPLIHEDRLCDSWIYEEEKEENHAGNMLSHCHGKKTPLYWSSPAPTEPILRGKKNYSFAEN